MDDEARIRRQIVARVTETIGDEDRSALLAWARQLTVIRQSPLSRTRKAHRAIRCTVDSRIAVRTAKIVLREIKKHGWDRRSRMSRGFIWPAAAGLLVFGSQGAGIAALGTAIGVPLWLVFGAGGSLLGALIEQLQKDAAHNPETEYIVIDAKKKESE